MTMDLTVERYATWDDLLDYMDGSAAVIGEMMLPILEPSDLAAATGPARDLGNAFQLTNFLRDIDEDLDRGRQYVPQEDIARFGADLTQRRVTPEFVDADVVRDRTLPDAVPIGRGRDRAAPGSLGALRPCGAHAVRRASSTGSRWPTTTCSPRGVGPDARKGAARRPPARAHGGRRSPGQRR